MSIIDRLNLMDAYENAKLDSYKEYSADSENTFYFDELGEAEGGGLPIIIKRENGRLIETFTEDTHGLVIGATRSGKTTGFIIPTILSKASRKRKDSMLVTDPKGELYRKCAVHLKNCGYKIILLNFRDYTHSECWNPLTPIFRKYQKINRLEDTVTAGKEGSVYKEGFFGRMWSKNDIFTLKCIKRAGLDAGKI